MSKELSYAGFVFLLGTALTAGAQPLDTPFHATGDRGETVKILPTPAKAGEAPGHPLYAPPSGFAVYRASYGSGNLVDHGGLEIPNAAFKQVFFNGSTYDATTATGINGFVNAFGGSVPDYTIIQQYGSHAPIAPGLTNAGVYDGNGGTPSTISDTQIQNYLAGAFAGGLAVSSSTIYGVYLPQGTTSTMGSSKSCTNYCGYHSHFTYAGTQIKYAVLPGSPVRAAR